MEQQGQVIHEMIDPAIYGYYLCPLTWIGCEPPKDESGNYNLTYSIDKTLNNGLRIKVRNDGLFVFNFTSTPDMGEVRVPKHTLNNGQAVPRPVQNKNKEITNQCVKRSNIMNAHRACILSATKKLKQVINPEYVSYINPSEMLRFLDVDNDHFCAPHYHPLGAFVLNEMKEMGVKQRRVVALNIVSESIEMLDQLLKIGDEKFLELYVLLYKASFDLSVYRFPESVIQAWTVIESLVEKIWNEFIDKKVRGNKQRKDRLRDTNYTSAIQIEILEIVGELTQQEYKRLTNIRKTRNAWIHGLKPINSEDASEALLLANQILEKVYGFPCSFNLTERECGTRTRVEKEFRGCGPSPP